jgi:hypothetical protein
MKTLSGIAYIRSKSKDDAKPTEEVLKKVAESKLEKF